MIKPSEAECDAIAKKLAELLEIDEAGWEGAASWIAQRASEEGIDLYAQWKTPRAFANSVVGALRSYINMQRFPDRLSSVNNYEIAEELFWAIFPDWKRSGL
jgi:hypothetical protein